MRPLWLLLAIACGASHVRSSDPAPATPFVPGQPEREPGIEAPEDDNASLGTTDSAPAEESLRVTADSPHAGWPGATCRATLDRAALIALVRRERREVQRCYEEGLLGDPSLEGDAMLRVVVGAKGRVRALRVGGSLEDNDVFACIGRSAERWAFPVPEGGQCVEVAIPFRLRYD